MRRGKPWSVPYCLLLSFPGPLGGEFDAGAYGEVHGGGNDYGTGRGTLDLTYNAGAVRDLGGSGIELSFNDGIGGLSLSLDNETNNITGVGIHLGPGFNIGGAGTIGGTLTARDALELIPSDKPLGQIGDVIAP